MILQIVTVVSKHKIVESGVLAHGARAPGLKNMF